MVKKIKVVDVVPIEAIEETQPIEEVPQVEEVTHVEAAPPIEDVKEEVEVEDKPMDQVEEVTSKGNEKSKPLEYINCVNCNKQILMKTYKYSHQKVCKAKPAPPPPPPPPTPEPKKERPKRVSKPKEKKEEPVETPKPEFSGVVSFDETKPVLDPYITMRQDRAMVRLQRVRSLISQAI